MKIFSGYKFTTIGTFGTYFNNKKKARQAIAECGGEIVKYLDGDILNADVFAIVGDVHPPIETSSKFKLLIQTQVKFVTERWLHHCIQQEMMLDTSNTYEHYYNYYPRSTTMHNDDDDDDDDITNRKEYMEMMMNIAAPMHETEEEKQDMIKMVTALETINNIHIPNLNAHIQINNREQWKKQKHIQMDPKAGNTYNQIQTQLESIKIKHPEQYQRIEQDPKLTEFVARINEQASPVVVPLGMEDDVFVPLCLEDVADTNNSRKRKCPNDNNNNNDNNNDGEPPTKKARLHGMFYLNAIQMLYKYYINAIQKQ